MIPGLRARVRLTARPAWHRQAEGSRIRSARAAVSSGAFLGLIAMLGMTSAMETVKPEWRDPEFGHRLARLRKLKSMAPARPLVLALGTSRTQNAIDPSAMDFPEEPGSPLVFNFGQSASPPLRVLLTFERLLDAGIHPSALVLETLPIWLVADGPAERVFLDTEARLSAGDLRRLAPYAVDRSTLTRNWLAARIAPWSAHRVVLMSHWLPRWLKWGERIDPQWEGMRPDGFVPYPSQFATSEFRAIATAHARDEHAGAFAGYAFGDSSVRALRDLVDRCRRERIAVIWVEPPVSPMFRGWFGPGVWDAGTDRLRQLATDLGVELLPPIEDLDEAHFIDGHHLLSEGARLYSRRLAEQHLKRWVAEWRGLTR